MKLQLPLAPSDRFSKLRATLGSSHTASGNTGFTMGETVLQTCFQRVWYMPHHVARNHIQLRLPSSVALDRMRLSVHTSSVPRACLPAAQLAMAWPSSAGDTGRMAPPSNASGPETAIEIALNANALSVSS